MKKFWIYSVIIITAIVATFSYHIIEAKWVDFRKAEKYFSQTRYSKAIEYYLKALKKNLDSHYISGKLIASALNTKIYQPIVEVYDKCLKKHPNDEKIIEGFVNFLVSFDQFEKAIDILHRYLKNNPEDFYIRLQLARVYFWQGQYSKAIIEYENVLKHRIKDIRIKEYTIRLEYVRMLAFSKNYNIAEKVYLDLIKEKSKDWKIYIELANLYLKQKDYNNVFNILKKIPLNYLDDNSKICLADLYAYNKKYVKASKIYDNYLKKYPKAKKVYLRYSQMLIWTKNIDKTKEVLEKIKYFYSSKDKVLIKLAEDCLFARQYSEAINVYKYLISRSKVSNPKLFIDLGNIYLSLNDKDEAIFYFQKAYMLAPKDQKIKRKYALSLSWSNFYEKAFPLLEELYKKNKEDQEVALALVGSYMKFKKFEEAKKLLEQLVLRFPDSVNVMMEYANYYAHFGHYELTNDIYKKILSTFTYRENILLGYADIMNSWGDFYKSEKIYRQHLKSYPKDPEVKYKLAWILTSMKRYEEATQIYLLLLHESIDVDRCYLQLAKVKLLQRKLEKALFYANRAYMINQSSENTFVLIQALISNRQFDEILQYFNIIKDDDYKKKAFIDIGKAFIKQNKEIARSFFQEGSQLYPDNIKLYFYANLSKILQKDFIDELFKKTKNAKDLTDIAWAYANEKEKDLAIRFFSEAIKKDEKYYPAKFGYAQFLGINNLSSIERLDELLEIFPDNYQILLWKARILGWTNNFKGSLRVYSILESINSKDPVIIREKARVASWDKKNTLAMQIYEKALHPTVDNLLYNSILTNLEEIEDPKLRKDLNLLKSSSIYSGYEKIKENFDSYSLNNEQKQNLIYALLNNLAEFEIQKAIFLEKKAKNLLYQMHYIHANKVYKELVNFAPSNQEALFDFAQTYCYLDLCDKSKPIYKILVEHFSHNRAEIAYSRNIIQMDPLFKSKHLYYEEKGRGDIDRIIRNKTDISLGYPIKCRYSLLFTPHRWVEKPTYARGSDIKDVQNLKGRTYDAYGYSVDFKGTFNKYVAANASFTQKYYVDDFKYTNLGHIHFLFNIYDWIKLNIGFDRKNKLDNIFSLRNDVQMNTLFVEANSIIERVLSINALSRSMIFSDNNFIQLCALNLGFKITDFPKIIRFSVRSEYRNSDKTSIYVYDGSDLVNIIYPYWTPRKYSGVWGSLSWYHDLSKLHFCGNEKHYYEFEFSGGSDTEKNPSIRFQAGWFYEFKKRCLLSIKGYVHRSKIWNSDSVQAEFKCNF